MSDFFKDIIKTTGNEYASLVSDGIEGADVDNFVDTGSYIFNALLSGSIYGGLPSNKITAIAGESATGKTFFVMGMVKSFLDENPDAGCLYFESESAITKQMVIDRGIDPNRMVDVRLNYEKGLDKYYGLLELAEKYNVFKKVSTRYELPDGSKEFGKTIMSNPTKYFTKDVMDILNECAEKEFKYGNVIQTDNE